MRVKHADEPAVEREAGVRVAVRGMQPPSTGIWLVALLMLAGSAVFVKLSFPSGLHPSGIGGGEMPAPPQQAQPDTIYQLSENAFEVGAHDAVTLSTVSYETQWSLRLSIVDTMPLFNDLYTFLAGEEMHMSLFENIPATIKAGFVTDGLAGSLVDCTFDSLGRASVTVRLPEPVITSCCIRYEEVSRRVEESHLIRSGRSLTDLLCMTETMAIDSMRARALAAGILEEAEANARERVASIMTALGAVDVTILIGDEQVVTEPGSSDGGRRI